MLHHDANARPFLVIWECTRACPLACRHCRADAQTQRQAGELSIDEAADLAGQIASFGNPAPLFVITGIFGMNVHFPGENTAVGFWVITGAMVASVIAMLAYFRHKGWM